MTKIELPREEDVSSEPLRPDAAPASTTIDATQTLGEMKGGRATVVEIGTVAGPVYIQAKSTEPNSGAEDLRQPTIKTSRFEPETVLIPAGPFLMGNDDPAAPAWERPQHEVELPDFRIGKYPVTLYQYAAFIKDQRDHPVPQGWFNRKPPQDRPEHPVTDVSWHDAAAYCAWLSQRTGRCYSLPSEAEWEKAASWDQGLGEKRKHPWGNEWLEGRCNVGSRGTTAVEKHSEGASAYGVEDLLGNVQEWTRSLWGEQPAQPEFGYMYDPADGREIIGAEKLPPQSRLVHRGGYFRSALADLRCTARGNSFTASKVNWRGFRVALLIAREV